MRRLLYRVAIVLAVIGSARAAPAAGEPGTKPAADCRALPRNIDVSARLVPLVEQFLEDSPTLRSQCVTIAGAANVLVTVRAAASPLFGCRARATIRRYGTSALRAVIELPVPGLRPELLAHELEHVIEQIQGLDLAALAREGQGVWHSGARYETDRASAIERVVAREIYDSAD